MCLKGLRNFIKLLGFQRKSKAKGVAMTLARLLTCESFNKYSPKD